MRYVMLISMSIAALLLASCQDLTKDTTSTSDSSQSESDTNQSGNFDKASHECLSRAMYFEARGTGERGMRAVGEVLLNRKASHKFPNTVCGVLNQRYNGSCQFSFMCDGHPEVYREPNQKAISDRLATELLTNRKTDITKGALFFHASWMRPGWFGTLSPRGRFGKQQFYR